MLKNIIRWIQPKKYIYNCIKDKKVRKLFSLFTILCIVQIVVVSFCFSTIYLFWGLKNVLYDLIEGSTLIVIILINLIQIKVATMLYFRDITIKTIKFEVITEIPSEIEENIIQELIKKTLKDWKDKKTKLKLEHVIVKVQNDSF
jgi:hypothetical protein